MILLFLKPEIVFFMIISGFSICKCTQEHISLLSQTKYQKSIVSLLKIENNLFSAPILWRHIFKRVHAYHRLIIIFLSNKIVYMILCCKHSLNFWLSASCKSLKSLTYFIKRSKIQTNLQFLEHNKTLKISIINNEPSVILL